MEPADWIEEIEEIRNGGLTWDEINALILQARETERERIVALLEEHIEDDEDQYRLGLAIALIKGEEQ